MWRNHFSSLKESSDGTGSLSRNSALRIDPGHHLLNQSSCGSPHSQDWASDVPSYTEGVGRAGGPKIPPLTGYNPVTLAAFSLERCKSMEVGGKLTEGGTISSPGGCHPCGMRYFSDTAIWYHYASEESPLNSDLPNCI